ncbi:RidA family protein [Sinirhodobacter populi]|uniref:RidA family protein n=1 Tax=Paenirhodobacter populi TaxID=2306993 RepID=A0A443KLW4_9RHOB|nr:RidA family protein [Sinirhodobacter populi]RWR27102.1 RidA family protein [Sinirhodobacter populi]RWR33823.1 RidA family protein [Sinirhodobacter populi]
MIERIEPNARMSMAVSWPLNGRMVVLSGQVADDRDGDVAAQTADILAKIDALLTKAGVGRKDIVSATIWLSDIATFDEMNAVWDAWVVPGSTPARACVEARLAHPSLRVEIQVHAVTA